MIRLAIDPGILGGIAWRKNSLAAHAIKMPETHRDIYDAIMDITEGDQCFCVIEKVGTYMPGNSGPSAATFAEHVGALKMALIAGKIPHEFVTPLKWQKVVIGAPAYDRLPKLPDEKKPFSDQYKAILKTRKHISAERKRDRKNKIKAKVQQVYPYLEVTLLTADALAMLWYMEKTA